MSDEVKRLESELASERAIVAGLRKDLERMKEDAFDGFAQLTAQREAALAEVRRLKKKHEPEPDPEPNVPSPREAS
jgi:hypothetical protein